MCQKINRLAQEIINCIQYLVWPWYLSRNDSVCWCYSFLCVVTTKRNGKFRHSWNDTFNLHFFLLHLITINHIFSRVTADRSTTHQGRDQTEMCLISGGYTRPVVKSKVNRFETSQNSSLHVNLHLIFPAGHRYSLCWTKKKRVKQLLVGLAIWTLNPKGWLTSNFSLQNLNSNITYYN